MAFYWGLMTAILVLKVFSSASENITSTAAPTTAAPNNTTPTNTATTPGVNGTTTSGVSPASPSQTTMITTTSAPTSDYYTYFNVSFKVDAECSQDVEDNLIEVIEELYDVAGFDYIGLKYSYKSSGGKCLFKMTIRFGPKLTNKNITETIENLAKNSTLSGYKISDLETNINVPGVILGKDFVVRTGDCKNSCCGTGGAIKLYKSCEPEYKCGNYKLEKMEPDCNKVCSEECSAGTFKISLMLLLLGVLTNWLLK